jgi:hypothetical protein
MGRYTVGGLVLSELEDQYSKRLEDYSLELDKIIRLSLYFDNEEHVLINKSVFSYNDILQNFVNEHLSNFINMYNEMKDNEDIRTDVHLYGAYIYDASKPYISYNRDKILDSLLNI